MSLLRFDRTPPPGGYAWWYVDAISNDGRHALAIIGFVGSVFSPYYAWSARRRPTNHLALNVALYGAGGYRWTMTERGEEALDRDAERLVIGPSQMRWEGDRLRILIDERAAPFPHRVSGEIVLHARELSDQVFELDPQKRHRWRPFAPSARAEVHFTHPRLSWRGKGYFDGNDGDEPLEKAFARWTWSRGFARDRSIILYDVTMRDGAETALALSVSASGQMTSIAPPPQAMLPVSRWRLPRMTRADNGGARIIESLEDGPFYARARIKAHVDGEEIESVHETLSLDRFKQPWVKMLLPFRMPRAL